MMTAIIFLAVIGLIVGAVALVGAGWDHWQWVRDGRPLFNEHEQLRIDVLRAGGRTNTSARREMLRLRQSPFYQTIQSCRDLDDLIENPAREGELVAMMPALTENLLATCDDDPAKQLFIEGVLSQDQSELGKKLLVAMHEPEKRPHITRLIATAMLSGKPAS